jgi:hypothetical protein
MPLLQPLSDLGANIGLPKQQKILVKIIEKCGGNKEKLCKITLLGAYLMGDSQKEVWV